MTSHPARPARRPLLAVLVAMVLGAPLLGVAPVGASSTGAATRAGVSAAAAPDERVAAGYRERLVYGRSLQGRDLVAYHLGEPAGLAEQDVETVLLMATMHGDEPASRHLLRALVERRDFVGVDLWVVPVYNPDGLAAGTRGNARGVDLNRNWPYRWADLDGRYESGSRPASEPETRAVMRLLRQVRPDRILSFHQPLHGVDTDTKDAAFAARVARALGLPRKTFDCGGVCHGTMTGWYNNGFRGSAVTVEYGARPSLRHLRTTAPRQVLSLFGAFRGTLAAQPWG